MAAKVDPSLRNETLQTKNADRGTCAVSGPRRGCRSESVVEGLCAGASLAGAFHLVRPEAVAEVDAEVARVGLGPAVVIDVAVAERVTRSFPAEGIV